MHAPTECHITLIKSMWLKSVNFLVPKRLSFPKIVCTICLINESSFLVSHIMINIPVILKGSENLLSVIDFNETTLRRIVVDKSIFRNFSTTCVLFEDALFQKIFITFLEQQFKLSGLMQYSLCVLIDLNNSVVTICLHILLLVSSSCSRFSFQEVLHFLSQKCLWCLLKNVYIIFLQC